MYQNLRREVTRMYEAGKDIGANLLHGVEGRLEGILGYGSMQFAGMQGLPLNLGEITVK